MEVKTNANNRVWTMFYDPNIGKNYIANDVKRLKGLILTIFNIRNIIKNLYKKF